MMDIIGIGSLNLDLIASSETINSLPQERVRDAYRILENCAGRQADLPEIEKVLSLLGRDSFTAALGGSAFNTVHALSVLGSGIRIGFVGISGNTGCGLDFKELMSDLSIDSSFAASLSEERSGICISVNRGGCRSMLIYPGCNGRISGHIQQNYEGIMKYLAEARLLHVTSVIDPVAPGIIAGAMEEVKRRNPNIRISFDPGLAWVKNITPAIARMIRAADITFLSAAEYRLLAGDRAEGEDIAAAGRIFEGFGLENNLIVAKLKSHIKLYSKSGGRIEERSFVNRLAKCDGISDATGAGDVFAAGFLAVMLRKGMEFADEAAELGSIFAYAKLTSYGDRIYPELARIYSEKF